MGADRHQGWAPVIRLSGSQLIARYEHQSGKLSTSDRGRGAAIRIRGYRLSRGGLNKELAN